MNATKGKQGERQYTEWKISQRQYVVVQRVAPGYPWYVFHIKGKDVKTVGWAKTRRAAEKKAREFVERL